MWKKLAFLVVATGIIALMLSGCIKTSYAVSGYVKTVDGAGLANVTISFNNGLPSVVTDSNGHWSAAGLTGDTVITPSLDDYFFSPSSLTTTNASNAVDFTAISSLGGIWTGSNNSYLMKLVITDLNSGNVTAIMGMTPKSTVAVMKGFFMPLSNLTGTFGNSDLSLSENSTNAYMPISISATVVNGKMSGTIYEYSVPSSLVLNESVGYGAFGLWNGTLTFGTSSLPVSFALAKDQNGDLSGITTLSIQYLMASGSKVIKSAVRALENSYSSPVINIGIDATGTVHGSDIQITASGSESIQGESIAMDIDFTGTISGNQASGSYTMNTTYNGQTESITGTWSATKQ
ncbi:MAG: hypothetical protein ACKVE4_11530 [Dissulfuribacterales bacterium]